MRILKKLTIKNFKSIREQTLELGPLNIFIGANGSGKSNLIEVFRFLREIVNQNLAKYTVKQGGTDTLFHYGHRRSPQMSFRLSFDENGDSNAYMVSLDVASGDSLYPCEEIVYSKEAEQSREPFVLPIKPDYVESRLKTEEHECARQALNDIRNCRAYHFNDTSDEAGVKKTCEINDNRFLRPQAENLAAFLYWMKKKEPNYYTNIRDTVRQIAPFFDDFYLEPMRLNEKTIQLHWTDKGSDDPFHASSLSDGTLRFICLATLLMQPEVPLLILIDEPELGLHPAAITLLAAMLSSTSKRTQILVATQSVTLIDQFDPDAVWTVEREDDQSVFRHLNEQDIASWLEDYSLGELWEKNVLGARP